MKQCPQCRQTYTDDTHFCLSDGTPLVSDNDNSEEATVFLPTQPTREEVTVFTPHREEITIVRPVQNIPPPVPTQSRGVSPVFVYLTIGLLVIMIGGAIIAVGIFALSQMSGNANSEIVKISNKTPEAGNKIDEQQANLRSQQEQLEKEKQQLANERKKLDEQKNKPVQTPTIIPPSIPDAPAVSPPPQVNYPPQPTARIKFGRGRVAESVSGKVYKERSFVLECRSGQFLSASVSGGGCVTFSNGGTSVGYSTISGDNRLTLVNNCNTESGFSMTVVIR